jgi:hypothetical protein
VLRSNATASNSTSAPPEDEAPPNEDRCPHQGALIEEMGRALVAISAQDVGGFFTHCGYQTPAQQLCKAL